MIRGVRQPAQDVGGAEAFHGWHDHDSSGPGFDFRRADNVFLGVVASFHQDIGAEGDDQVDGSRRIKGHDRVGGGEGSENAGALCARRDDGTTVGPLRRETEASLLMPMTTLSPNRRQSSSRAMWPTCRMSKQPLVKTTVFPEARHSAARTRRRFRSRIFSGVSVPGDSVSAATSSWRAIGTVPSLPTTIPAAMLARRAASSMGMPLAVATARVAMHGRCRPLRKHRRPAGPPQARENAFQGTGRRCLFLQE